jgi:hypothetical protein
MKELRVQVAAESLVKSSADQLSDATRLVVVTGAKLH